MSATQPETNTIPAGATPVLVIERMHCTPFGRWIGGERGVCYADAEEFADSRGAESLPVDWNRLYSDHNQAAYEGRTS